MDKPYFKKSNEYTQRLGKRLDISYTIKSAKSCPKTSLGMSRVADAEYRDDLSRTHGFNNYSMSIAALMDAYDTFIREFYKHKFKTGLYPYNLAKPCELTIKIIWLIRHTWSHSGGLIDGKCSKSYNKVMATTNGVKPVIDLPLTINKGDRFHLEFEDYKKLKNCIMEFIKQRVDSEDYKILASRSCNTNFIVKDAHVSMAFAGGTLIFNLVEAYDHGFKLIKNKITPPEGTQFNFDNSFIELPNGEYFPAIYVKENQ